jgi:oxygen-independent coproporphyrinogen-3 oxidase
MTLARHQLPINRSYCLSNEERVVRKFVLQLKLGSVSARYFDKTFNINVLEMFLEPLQKLKKKGFLIIAENDLGVTVELTRAGLLCVDRLLPEFYQPEFKDVRYA